MKYYLRSELAKIANINSETLRFYEKNKLIPIPKRAENGYRQYPETTLVRLQLINKAKNVGFTLNQIKDLFAMAKSKHISLTDIIADAVDVKIKEIDDTMNSLKDLKKILVEFNKEIQVQMCPDIEYLLNNYTEKQTS